MAFAFISHASCYKISCGFHFVSHTNHYFQSINGTACDIFTKLIWNETITKVVRVKEKFNGLEELFSAFLPRQTAIDLSNITKVDRVKIQELVNFPAGIDKMFPNVALLGLNNLGIKNVHQKDLAGFQQLNRLDLSNNQLTVLEKDLFKNNLFLMSLNLRANELKVIDPNVFKDLKYLTVVSVVDNFCTSDSADNRVELSNFIENVRRDCSVKEHSKVEVSKKVEKTFNWRKYFWYFVIFGTSFSSLAAYYVARMLFTVKVSPEDENKGTGSSAA